MAAPNVNGRLHLTGFHQKPPYSFLSDLRLNMIDDYFNRNHCINQMNCFVCNRFKNIKNDYIKLKLKRLKRVREIIKHRTARINKILQYCLII